MSSGRLRICGCEVQFPREHWCLGTYDYVPGNVWYTLPRALTMKLTPDASNFSYLPVSSECPSCPTCPSGFLFTFADLYHANHAWYWAYLNVLPVLLILSI